MPGCILISKSHLGLDHLLLTHRRKTNLCGILLLSATSDLCTTCLTDSRGVNQADQIQRGTRRDLLPPGPAERWQGESCEPLPSVVHTTRHLLKYDQSPAPPCSSYGGSSFQHAHKGWVQLNGLNGSRAPGHGGSDQLNGPHCVPMVTGG